MLRSLRAQKPRTGYCLVGSETCDAIAASAYSIRALIGNTLGTSPPGRLAAVLGQQGRSHTSAAISHETYVLLVP